MFSGKTEELLRRLRRVKIANQALAIFKPEIDIRYSEMRIVSHDANYFPSLPIKNVQDIIKNSVNAEVVAIDESQFFDEGLLEVANQLALDGKRVIIAGLDMDYLGKPFGLMPNLMAIADYVTKLNAICICCGNLATHSFRFIGTNNQIMLGEKDNYQPRCRSCFNTGMLEQKQTRSN